MSRNGKIAVAIVAGLVVLLVALCGCACFASALFSNRSSNWEYTSARFESGESIESTDEIARFEVPQGFVAGEAGSALGVHWVEMHPADADGHIMLLGAPAELGLSAARIAEMAEDAADWDIDDGRGNTVDTDTVEVSIRGQSVILVRAHGINHDGDAYQSLTGMFEGRNGPVLLSIALPDGEWDQDAIDAFLASID
ncbi:MAG: hypothetical protein ACYC5O_15535 [Anaerolineae bacterium]